MTASGQTVDLKKALKLDFTGTCAGIAQYDSVNPALVKLLRQPREDGEKLVVLIDRVFGSARAQSYVVADHINLTGSSPLVGANPSCGTRFPVINGIYVRARDGSPVLTQLNLEEVIVAGLKAGIEPSPDDVALMRELGAQMWCYNIVPAMIVAAHAGWKVLAVAVSEGGSLPEELKALLN